MRYFLAELKLYICNHFVAKLPSNRLRLSFYRHAMKYAIGKGSTIHLNCEFDATRKLEIGENSVINSKCRLDTRGGVNIGNNVSVSSEVILLTADHDMDSAGMDGRVKPITIGDNAWIGTRVTILPGVRIGEGAVVAAGAVVTKNVSPYDVVAGIPAKIIRQRGCKGPYTYSATYKRLLH